MIFSRRLSSIHIPLLIQNVTNVRGQECTFLISELIPGVHVSFFFVQIANETVAKLLNNLRNNFFLWLCVPTQAMASSFLRFLDHT